MFVDPAFAAAIIAAPPRRREEGRTVADDDDFNTDNPAVVVEKSAFDSFFFDVEKDNDEGDLLVADLCVGLIRPRVEHVVV